jgi:hypothetical protein
MIDLLNLLAPLFAPIVAVYYAWLAREKWLRSASLGPEAGHQERTQAVVAASVATLALFATIIVVALRLS